MSKEEVPGEKRTVSPSCAIFCARSTAAPNDAAISHSVASRQSCATRCRDFANQNGAPHFASDERRNRVEGKTFVLPAGDQDDWPGRAEQRFFQRIEIRRLRIVHILDPADRANEFEAMQLGAVSAKRWNHLLQTKDRARARRPARPSCFRRCAARAIAPGKVAGPVADETESSRRLTKSRRRSSRR